MTDNDCIAVHIMGWCKSTYGSAWLNPTTLTRILLADWHPDTDPSQAMMVCEALRAKHYRVNLDLLFSGDNACKVFRLLSDKELEEWGLVEGSETLVTDAYADRLESAIHAAAVQVARIMEETANGPTSV